MDKGYCVILVDSQMYRVLLSRRGMLRSHRTHECDFGCLSSTTLSLQGPTGLLNIGDSSPSCIYKLGWIVGRVSLRLSTSVKTHLVTLFIGTSLRVCLRISDLGQL